MAGVPTLCLAPLLPNWDAGLGTGKTIPGKYSMLFLLAILDVNKKASKIKEKRHWE